MFGGSCGGGGGDWWLVVGATDLGDFKRKK